MNGLNLPYPHGFLLWKGKKRAIVLTAAADKAMRPDLVGRRVVAVSRGEAYGEMIVTDPILVTADELDRDAEKHLVRPDERKTWWPDTLQFAVYPIAEFEPYPAPQSVEKMEGDFGPVRLAEPTADERAVFNALPRQIVLIDDAVALGPDGLAVKAGQAAEGKLREVVGTLRPEGREIGLYSLALVRKPAPMFREVAKGRSDTAMEAEPSDWRGMEEGEYVEKEAEVQPQEEVKEMPKPRTGESERDFISRCVPMIMDEGKPNKQAVAICYSLWEDRQEQAEKQATVPEPEPDEGKGDFILRCIPALGQQGLDAERSKRVCWGRWDQHVRDRGIREDREGEEEDIVDRGEPENDDGAIQQGDQPKPGGGEDDEEEQDGRQAAPEGAGEDVKYSPSQPRVPEGSPGGGQWTSGGGGGGDGGGPDQEATGKIVGDAITGLPRDISKATASQQRKVVAHLAKKPLKELRRHQDLIRQQHDLAYQTQNTRALENLDMMDRLVIAAIDRREFGKQMEGEEEKAGRRVRSAFLQKLRDAVDTLKELLRWGSYEEEEPEEPTFLDLFKQSEYGMAVKAVNGQPWMVTWSTNAFKDRQEEMFSTASLERYVAESEKADDRGTFDFWHIPGTDFADKKWQGVIGRFLVEAGPFRDNKMGQAAKAFFEKHPRAHPSIAPEGWGCSPQFRYLPEDRKGGTYHWLWIMKTSVLPRAAAANVWTKGEVLMAKLTEEQKAAAAAIFGEEFVNGLVEEGERRTKELEEAGVAHKQADKWDKAKKALLKLAEECEDKELSKALSDASGELDDDNAAETAKQLKKAARKMGGDLAGKLRQMAEMIAPEEEEEEEEKPSKEEKGVDLEALLAQFTEAVKTSVGPVSQAVSGLTARLDALEAQKALAPRRASEAAETVVGDDDPLVKMKLFETVERPGTMANAFFPKK